MKKFLPEKDRLLVELDPIKEKKVGMVIVPEKRHERVRYGVVLAVGKPAIPEDEGRFNVGDTIVIRFYVGKVIRDYELGWNDDDHRVCRYDEILGKFVG